jgi:hypothetical protein
MATTMREGWASHTLGEITEQLSTGPLQDKKSCQPAAPIPIVDQSEAGYLGYHIGTPGIDADEKSPVVTFANHTAAVRLHTAPFSVIQNVFPKIGKREMCTTRYLYLVAQNRVVPGDYRGYHPEWRRTVVPIPPHAEQHRIVDLMGAVDAYVAAADARVEAARTARSALLSDLLSTPGEDWVETTLGEIVRLEYGKALPEHARNGNGFPVYGSSGVVGFHSEPLVPEGPVIVVGRKGTAGAVMWSKQPCSPIDTAYYAKIATDAEPRFVYELMRFIELPAITAQTGVPGLNRDRAHELRCSLPPLPEQRRIVDLMGAFDGELGTSEMVAADARTLRTALLTDLLSGAREIPASYDRFLEAA